jgi:single-strand DNA-binding protein
MRDITVTFTGNIATPPALVGGTRRGADSVIVFRVAVNPTWFDRGRGEWKEKDPEYFSVFVRGQQAENAFDSLHAGEPVFVTGRLSSSEYALKDTGEMTRGNTVNADAVGHTLTFGTSRFTKVTREPMRSEAQDVLAGDAEAQGERSEGGAVPGLGTSRPASIVAPVDEPETAASGAAGTDGGVPF